MRKRDAGRGSICRIRPYRSDAELDYATESRTEPPQEKKVVRAAETGLSKRNGERRAWDATPERRIHVREAAVSVERGGLSVQDSAEHRKKLLSGVEGAVRWPFGIYQKFY